MGGVPATYERRHDERYLVLLREDAAAKATLSRAIDRLRSQSRPADIRRDDHRTISEVLDDHADLRAATPTSSYKYGQYFGARDDYDLAHARAGNHLGNLVDHESHYTGWQRFFLVVSSAGLVHRA